MKKHSLRQKIVFIFGFALIFAICLVSVGNVLFAGKNSKVSFAEGKDESSIVTELSEMTDEIASEYSLGDDYPILSENQTLSSNLCWIYSSMKVLETSLMVQKNEYHNFSETAVALLNYLNSDQTTESINPMSSFSNFSYIIQREGVVFESDFSNDYFLDLNKNKNDVNYDNFAFVKNYANKEIIKDVKPLMFYQNNLFASLAARVDKTTINNVIKRYIKRYGGLFVGIEPGLITYDDSTFKVGKVADSPSDRSFTEPHALCMIGWNETGFVVLNSWGKDVNDFRTFIIPYDYDYIYSTICGFVCTDEDQDFVCTTSNATEFSSSVLPSDKVLKNVFTTGENISLSYSITNRDNLERAYVNVFSGMTDVTSMFTYNFDGDGTFQVLAKSENLNKYASSYTVKVLIDGEIQGCQDFYVFSGTEVSYVKFYRFEADDREQKIDIQLQNNLSTNKNSTTFYASDGGNSNASFRIDMFLPEISNASKISTSLGQVSEILAGGEKQQNTNISVVIQKASNNDMFRLLITNLVSGNQGKFFEIPISFTSNGYTRNYNFTFYIGSENASTRTLNSIVYILDGGLNSTSNIDRYPGGEGEMTSEFTLQKPVRLDGAEFTGWYDKDGEEVTKIDSSCTGDLILYAKWRSLETDYMTISLSRENVTHYGESSSEDFSEEYVPVYGDSLSFKFVYTPNLDNLAQYKYNAVYDYFINDQRFEGEELGAETTKSLGISFEDLSAGDYVVRVKVTMVVSHSYSYFKEQFINFSVNPLEVRAQFNSLTTVYNTLEQRPEVTLIGVLPESGNVEAILLDDRENATEKNAGTYNFRVVGVSDENYCLGEEYSNTFTINPAQCWVEYNNVSFVYNGLPQYPEFTIKNDYDEFVSSTSSIRLNGEAVELRHCINAGTYIFTTNIDSGGNYTMSGSSTAIVEFEIERRKITITFDSLKQRITLAPNNRAKVTWKVEGLAATDTPDMLNVSYKCDAINATESGVYEITGSYNNSNYDATIVSGTYTILGEYYVFYTFPDGTEYTEVVASGENPKGIDRSIHKGPLFGKVVYSDPLVYSGTDLFIKVTYKNYNWAVIVAVIVIVLVAVYVVSNRMTKKSKSR